MPKTGYVYILASDSRELYIGVTANPCRRWQQHRSGEGSVHVREHGIHRLVLVEAATTIMDAIRREKELKRWKRIRKLELIEASNPEWRDLSVEWGWDQLSP
ncbi:MAG: GIY-YIG nuclease family protein [Gemmatimonadota bacterium]